MQAIWHSTFFNPCLLAGILFLFMGFFIRRFPPNNMNKWYGYRTYLSTKNQQMWDEANQYAAYLSRKMGGYLFLLGIAIGLAFPAQNDWFYYLSCGAVIICALLLVGLTEWHLSQNFDEQGNKKNNHPPTLNKEGKG